MVNIAEEYMGFVDEVNDAKLLALASERMQWRIPVNLSQQSASTKNLASRRMTWTQLVT